MKKKLMYAGLVVLAIGFILLFYLFVKFFINQSVASTIFLFALFILMVARLCWQNLIHLNEPRKLYLQLLGLALFAMASGLAVTTNLEYTGIIEIFSPSRLKVVELVLLACLLVYLSFLPLRLPLALIDVWCIVYTSFCTFFFMAYNLNYEFVWLCSVILDAVVVVILLFTEILRRLLRQPAGAP